jgi:hypothetical protein
MFFVLFLLNDRRTRIQETQKHADPVDPVRIWIRIRNTGFNYVVTADTHKPAS